MPDQEIIRLLKQTRDLLAFHRELGLDTLPGSAGLAGFLAEPGSAPGRRGNPSSPCPTGPAAPAVSLTTIKQETAACRRCPCGGEADRVPGSGGPESGLVVVADPAPAGFPAAPFAGPAGELLAKMLAAIGLAREQVYVTPLLKCALRRTPAPEELARCLALLEREVAAAAPKVMCAMGPLAAAALVGSREPIFGLRGRFHRFRSLPLMVTFHPAYLLKNPEMKKATWLDLQAIQKELARR